MSLQPTATWTIPELTARIAHAAFPHSSTAITLRDALGPIYADEQFADLFAARGAPAEAPWRLALVTVLQYTMALSDRQAADAVRARIDWKYALGLPLEDPGFDHTVLCTFRKRVVAGSAEERLLDALLERCRAVRLLDRRGRQRTDSTTLFGVLRVLNRLELLGETLRATLNALARVEPAWVQAHIPPDWYLRYGRRIEEGRLPESAKDRQASAAQVGADGIALVEAVYAREAPPQLRDLEAVQTLRRVWLSQVVVIDDQVQLRSLDDLPPTAARIESPYETEARYGEKRGHGWVGYKIHLTEGCEPDAPHLVTEVETTLATVADLAALARIQATLARRDLLPAQQVVDSGYMAGHTLVSSRQHYAIDLVGPLPPDHSPQAKADQGFALANFTLDWEAQVATCPQGKVSERWLATHRRGGQPVVHVQFAAPDCGACPVHALCTRAAVRRLTLQERAAYEAVRAARERQQGGAFAALYAQRAGVEGTMTQGLRACAMRQARYRGLAKTRFQEVATAVAINVLRVADWVEGRPRARTRTSPFLALSLAG